MSSLATIKTIKQSAKNDGDLIIINNLLIKSEKDSEYFPDRELFCLEHLVSRINSTNIKTIVNDCLLYDNFELIYKMTLKSNKAFVTILKNIKLNMLLLNIDFSNKTLVNVLNKKFLGLIIKSNIQFQEINSEKFILKLLTQFLEHKIDENEIDINFISNILKLIQFNKFFTNNEVLLKLVQTNNYQVNEILMNEMFNDKLFKLTPFIENLKADCIDDIVLFSLFKLIALGYLTNSDKFGKEIIDLALNSFVEKGNNKAQLFLMCLDFINNNFELKKLNNLPKIETIEKWLNGEFIGKVNSVEISNIFIKCLKNNIEVGYKYKVQILSLLEKLENTELCEAMIDCFVDFKEFDMLIKHVVDNDLTYMASYGNLFSDRIHNLTSYQLNELLSGDCKFLKNSIIKGMINVNTITFIQNNELLQKWLKQSIFEHEKLENSKTLYYLLDLYSKSIIPNISFNEEIKESYTQELNHLIDYQLKEFDYKNIDSYICIFKTFEITIEYDTVVIDIKNLLSKFVKNFGKKLSECVYLLKTFITIINNNINLVDLKFLLSNLLANEKSIQLLVDELFFSNTLNIAEIWEERVIVDELIKLLIESILASKSENHFIIFKQLLNLIPIEVFNKYQRNIVLEKLYTLKNAEELQMKFLSIPSFKSSLELQENFEKLLNHNNINLLNKIWTNYLLNINDITCYDYLNKSIIQLTESLDKINDKQLAYLISIIKYSKDAEKIKPLLTNLFEKVLKKLKKGYTKNTSYYYYIYQLYELISDNDILNNIITEIVPLKNIDTKDEELEYNLFVSYSMINNKDYYFILPAYLKLRSESKINGITSGLIIYLNAVTNKNKETTTVSLLNDLITELGSEYKVYLLELINYILPNLIKNENEEIYSKLFALMLNQLINNPEIVNLEFLQNLSNIVITKSWILKQYNIELIFPFLIKVISRNNDELNVLESLKIVSNIINYQQFKLQKRTHLVNSFIIFLMESIMNTSYANNINTIKSLNRLIANYIDPINIMSISFSHSPDSLKSNVLSYKQDLRKYIYPIMLKYVSLLCDVKSSNASHLKLVNLFRNGLKLSMYSIFDLMIKENINLMYNLLDYNGKLYFKKLYKDYEVEGKWKED
ncbi:hypothetical protein QEN19_003456 [Hanseniaspora menglaensis]